MKTNFLVFAIVLSTAFLMSCATAQVATNLTPDKINAALDEAYNKFKDVKEGKNADYIKELATVDSKIFGIALVTTDGTVYTKGDVASMVSIQSVSKAFVAAQVIEEMGHQAMQDKIGVDATGEVFNSIVAVERMRGKEINPLVNPGAIAATSLVAGKDSAAIWKSILMKQSDFAGRQLSLNMPVYIRSRREITCEIRLSHICCLPMEGCILILSRLRISIPSNVPNVSAKDLATMGATLANGGVNPVSKKKVVSPETVMYTLPIMATAGLYDDSGIWYYNSGLPAKSGVGGGIVAVCQGKFGIGVVSPLDAAGNSVKAQMVIKYVVEKLGVNPFLIQPK